jgi:hypothetical protein
MQSQRKKQTTQETTKEEKQFFKSQRTVPVEKKNATTVRLLRSPFSVLLEIF